MTKRPDAGTTLRRDFPISTSTTTSRRHRRPRGLGIVEPGSNPTESETSLVRSSALVAVGTMLSRVTGFARIAAIAYALGASTLAGTYSYANEAPNIVYELLLGGVLTATLVPLFVKYHETDDDDAPSAIFTVAIVALAAITVIGVVAAPWIVDLYTLNVKGSNVAAQQQLATDLLRLFMPQMLFYGIVTLATAMLNAPATLPRGRVRAGAQQRRRDRGVPRAPPHRRRLAHRQQRARRPGSRPAHRAGHDRRAWW